MEAKYFDLSPPPRPVPWSLRLAMLLTGGSSFAGWFLLDAGLLYRWLLLRQAASRLGPVGARFVVATALGVIVVALWLIGSGLKRNLSALRLLRNGKLAFGKLVDKEVASWKSERHGGDNGPLETGTEWGYARRHAASWRLRFEFLAEDGTTYQPERIVWRDPAALLDEKYERIVYNPAAPWSARLMDELGPGIGIDPVGRLYFRGGWGGSLLVLFSAALVAASIPLALMVLWH